MLEEAALASADAPMELEVLLLLLVLLFWLSLFSSLFSPSWPGLALAALPSCGGGGGNRDVEYSGVRSRML